MPNRREVEDSFEAVPAYIVADKRDRFGKRLGQIAIGLLILFFLISSYVQAARNGAQLDEARKQRASLIKSQELTFEGLKEQGALIVQLQGTITRQNELLKKAGLPVEPVPNLQDLINKLSTPRPNPSSGSNPRPSTSNQNNPNPGTSPRPQPHPSPTANPQPKPSPKPTPSPTRGPIKDPLCSLTHVCF